MAGMSPSFNGHTFLLINKEPGRSVEALLLTQQKLRRELDRRLASAMAARSKS
jgi:hypothetical protein